MLELGIILIIIAVVLLLAPIPLPNKDPIGWILVLIGAVLVILAVVDINCSGAHC